MLILLLSTINLLQFLDMKKSIQIYQKYVKRAMPSLSLPFLFWQGYFFNCLPKSLNSKDNEYFFLLTLESSIYNCTALVLPFLSLRSWFVPSHVPLKKRDRKLTWMQPYINTMETKARKKMGIMKKSAGTKIHSQVYTEAVRPDLEYGVTFFASAAKSNTANLDGRGWIPTPGAHFAAIPW